MLMGVHKWFEKPRIDQNSRRGEGWVGFLVRECIADGDVRHEESVWMKERERSFVYILICQLRVVRQVEGGCT